MSYTTETATFISGIWLQDGLVRSLYSSHKRVFCGASLDFSDLTRRTSNHIHLAFAVVYDTL